jgi:hypothetical protein
MKTGWPDDGGMFETGNWPGERLAGATGDGGPQSEAAAVWVNGPLAAPGPLPIPRLSR